MATEARSTQLTGEVLRDQDMAAHYARATQISVEALRSVAGTAAAGEFDLHIKLMMGNGSDALIFIPDAVKFDQAGQGHLDRVVSVTTTEQMVSFSGIQQASQVVIQNLDQNTDNYVQYGSASGSYIGRIYGAKPKRSGTADKLSWEPGAPLYIVGNVAQKVRVIVCET